MVQNCLTTLGKEHKILANDIISIINNSQQEDKQQIKRQLKREEINILQMQIKTIEKEILLNTNFNEDLNALISSD